MRPSSEYHYSDVIRTAMASQITSVAIVYSIVYSGADQRKHRSFVSLAFVRAIHRWPVYSPHKGPVTGKFFHLMTSSWPTLVENYLSQSSLSRFRYFRGTCCRITPNICITTSLTCLYMLSYHAEFNHMGPFYRHGTSMSLASVSSRIQARSNCWPLTHWGRDKMDAVSQTTVSNAFSWMKMYGFRLKFHWTLFSRVQLTTSQHWFR